MSSASPSPEPDPSRLRIGDAERNSALEALGEHMASGRLTMDEYGERSTKVTQARTIADLRGLFDDLPPPHPELPDVPDVRPQPAASPARRPGAVPARSDARSTSQRVAGAVLAVSGIVSLLLFFWLKTWVVFLLPAVVAVISGAIWGSQGRDNG